MIEKMENAGNRVLYTIGKGGKRKELFERLDLERNADVQKFIAKGVENKIAFIDGYHGTAPKDLTVFRKINVNAFAYYNGLTANKEKLFQSGVFVMSYSRG